MSKKKRNETDNMTDAEKRRAYELYSEGWTDVDIACELRVTVPAVREWRHAAGKPENKLYNVVRGASNFSKTFPGINDRKGEAEPIGKIDADPVAQPKPFPPKGKTYDAARKVTATTKPDEPQLAAPNFTAGVSTPRVSGKAQNVSAMSLAERFLAETPANLIEEVAAHMVVAARYRK